MRILGLDYGSKTVGVAVSDGLGITAQGLGTIHRKEEMNLKETIIKIKAWIDEYQVERIVLGYPVKMNFEAGERVEKTERFKRRLDREFGIEVIMWDERLTTLQSERLLFDAGIASKRHKEVIDTMAATLILQSYMDATKNKKSNE